jgi:hypothetical protein
MDKPLPAWWESLARFKKQDFVLTMQNQVGQVIKVIASRHQLPMSVAEEVVGSKLKLENLACSQDLVVKDQDLYSCRLNEYWQA